MRGMVVLALAIVGGISACAATGERTPAVASHRALPPAPGASSDAAPARRLPVDTLREDVADQIHGLRVLDPYRWLEDGESERVRTWIAKENEYTRTVLDRIPDRPALHSRIESLMSVGDVEEPTAVKTAGGGWRYFYEKRTGLQNQPVLYMRDGIDGADRVVIDVNALAADGTIALDWYYPSSDGRLVAYGTSRNGDEASTLRVRDVSGAEPKDLSDEIGETRHCSLAWRPDSKSFFYTRYPKKGEVPEGEEKYHQAVYEHRIGADSRTDPMIFGQGREMTDSPAVELSPDGRWLVLEVYQGWSKNELYVIDLRDKRRTLVPVARGVEALYDAIPLNDRLIVQTNEGAPLGRVVSIDPRQPARDRWKELVAQTSDAIDSMVVASERIVLSYQHDAASVVRAFGLRGQPLGDIPLPSIGTASLLASVRGQDVFIRFRSFVVPSEVLRVSLKDERPSAPTLWQRVESPLSSGGYAVDQYKATSKDGTAVPYFVVRQRDVRQDGTAAALLTGYGGFNIAMNPRFIGAAGAFLDRGGVYVQAILRGGAEFGETWHQAGMLERKQNVFDDMAAVARDVGERKIAAADRLGIMGASNGGLLAAAMIVQHPSLFRVAVPRVPLTDMMRYQSFLLAKFWVPEYGSSDDARMAPVLLAYSPYHHVEQGVAYPAVLLTAGESDARVDPMHARKMAAALQAATTSEHPVLLRTETNAGHGAGKPISKQIEEFTDVYGFVMNELGMLQPRGNEDARQPR